MKLSSSSLSKLNIDSVRHIVYSNPYDPLRLGDGDLLLKAVKHTLSNIHKLDEICKVISSDNVSQSILHLQKNTEELLLFLEPAGSGKDTAGVRNTTTKPWTSTLPSQRKKIKGST